MRCCILLIAVASIADFASAEVTNVTVRVVARNAQYVGDLVGGAFVTISDASSGEMLAQGVTKGAPGNPKRTMDTPRRRGEAMAAGGDARFAAALDIDEPRYVRVTAYGPLGERFSANAASATQWIVPGKHLTGSDGWVLELPGLLVTPNLKSSTVSLSKAAQGVTVEAEVMLMCGCPIKAGFYWDPEDYEVAAIVRRADAEVGRFPLRYAGAASEFETQLVVDMPGVYDIVVYAYDPASGNTGVGKIDMTVTGD